MKPRQAKTENQAAAQTAAPLFPAFFSLRDRRCVVAGAGRVAQRKILHLLACGARVVVVSPTATQRIAGLARQGRIVWHRRPWSSRHLAGAFLVFAATDDPGINSAVGRQCRERGIPANVADAPEACDFTVPACVRRGGLSIAVSSGGASPAYAAAMCRLLEEALNDTHGPLLEQLSRIRRRLQCLLPDAAARRKILKNAVDSVILALKSNEPRRLSKGPCSAANRRRTQS